LLTYKDIYRLILQGESQVLDFKKTISHPEKIAKTLVAFANTKGGMLLVGVLDNGEVAGVNIEEEAYQIHKSREIYCKPIVEVELHEIEDGKGHSVLLVQIPESKQKPHFALDKNEEWTAYVRMDDHSVIASKEHLRLLKKGVGKPSSQIPKEGKAVMQYLQQQEKITVKILAKLLNISERRSKRVLIDMMQAGWLMSHDFEKEIFYTKA
jgi:predicted HTH transcriptional regulator